MGLCPSTEAGAADMFQEKTEAVQKLQGKAANKMKNVFAAKIGDEEIANFKLPEHPRTDEEIEFIKGALKNNFVFEHLQDHELGPFVKAFEKIQCDPQEELIKQGDEGDYLYIITEGKCDFSVDGKVVGSAEKGDSFGELALMYKSPRAATVTALTATELFRVDQKSFRYILQTQTEKGTHDKIALLRGVAFLKGLSELDIAKLANAMVSKTFAKGDCLAKKGDVGDFFYIIKEGTVEATDVGAGNQKYDNVTFKAGDYVGERSLVTGEPRAANIMARTSGMAYGINKETFDKILGNLKEAILKAQDKSKISGIPCIHICELDPAVIAALTQKITDKEYKAGDAIVTEGEPSEAALYLVRSGKVNITTKSKSGEKSIVRGDYFGEEQLLADANSGKNKLNDPSTVTAEYTATVSEDASCGVLHLKDCRAIIDTLQLGKEPPKIEEGADIAFKDLKRHKLLGAGTFGQVWLVSNKASDKKEAYALKVQCKYELCKDGQAQAVLYEKNIMAKMKHPFIARLYNTYQDKNFVYMLLNLVQGGELYSVMCNTDRGLPEKDAKFYAAAVSEGLAYMHRRGYVYRDLKPENVLIDNSGYPVIIDFGFAKLVKDKTYTLCGTPLYLPPEVILNRGHNWSADHWSLGILIYEMCSGKTPFYMDGMEQMDLFRNIVKGKFSVPRSFSKGAKQIVNAFIVKNPSQRLGSLKGGESDIQAQPWFDDIDFQALTSKEIKAPFVPKIKDPFDTSNFDDWSHLEDKTKQKYPALTAKQKEIFKTF